MTSEAYGTVRWFGPSWNAPVNDPCNEIPVPFGEECMDCGEKIRDERTPGIQVPYTDGDTVGRATYHRDCFLQAMGIHINKEPS